MKHTPIFHGRALLAGSALTLAASSVAWGQVQPVSYLDDLPPLVDREVFFGNPVLAYGALSPDGQYVSIVKPLDGILNVWVRRADQTWEDAWPCPWNFSETGAGPSWLTQPAIARFS